MKNIEEFFSRHSRVAFQFSSGKDSAAVLWLLRDYWDRMDIVWTNPGNPYPETLDYMYKISKMVPRFKVVLGEQPSDIAANGWPVDIVPTEDTAIGRTLGPSKGVRLRPFWQCCTANLWKPSEAFIKQGDYSGVIRGQKHSDVWKGPTTSGEVIEGVEYLYPIEDWTDMQVLEFLGERAPASYKRGLKSSLDCMNCTAYASENPGRIADLKAISETAWQQVSLVHVHLTDRMAAHAKALENLHGD